LVDVVVGGTDVVGGSGGMVERIGSTIVSVATVMAYICCSTGCNPPTPAVTVMVMIVVESAQGNQVPGTVIVFVV
jgi:hypothetical protein